MFTAYYGNWDYWQLFHKVTFDGVNKLIKVNDGELNIDIKQDIYSAWKEWISLRDYAKFLPAIRTTGGDPTPTGYSGDMYFLLNGWQIDISQRISITGILYHDDPISPYVIHPGGGIIATVSNLALGTSTSGGANAVAIRQEMDANSSKLIDSISKLDALTVGMTNVPSNVRTNLTSELGHLMTLTNAPTSSANAIAMRSNLTNEISHLMSLSNMVVPTINDVAIAIRTELTPELTIINSQVNGLTPEQLSMLTAMYSIMGLDPTKPLVVTPTTVSAGTITQTVSGDDTQTTVTRNV